MQETVLESKQLAGKKKVLLGNRIPKDFFVTSGIGQSDVTVHAGSFHIALRDAGIERYNIINYSSILPGIATRLEKPPEQVHGAVMETIMACSNAKKGENATAGLIFGWLYNKSTGDRYGGLVCEYSGNDAEDIARDTLEKSLMELYDGFTEEFELRDIEINLRSFVPDKKFGTALVSICFVNYEFPVLES